MNEILAAALGAVILASAAFFFLGRRVGRTAEVKRLVAAKSTAEETAKRIVTESEREAENLRKSAVVAGKEELIRLREKFESEVRGRREEVEREERRITERENVLDRKSDVLEQRDRELGRRASEFGRREKTVVQREEELATLIAEERRRLEQMAGMSAQDAKAELVRRMEEEAQADAANRVREIRETARRNAEREAKKFVALAIQRIAAEHTAESTVSAVPLPSDEMKGRIIGREGRNIRALEQATGIDLIIDDTPETVILSGFDPVRREIARLAVTKLIADGRIHPGRIEEVVNKARAEVELIIRQAGEQAAYDAGVPGLPSDLLRLLGRLKYRTSYGQNVLVHSVETSHLAAVMAAELGADINAAKIGGLLHDIGKAVDHEVEGPHAASGAAIAQKHNMPMKVVNGIAAHHQEVEFACIEAPIVQVADAISASRPGARGETMETYVKRLEDLQGIAESFAGVERSFAVQAGREVRILVRPEEIDDLSATRLARDIVKKIEDSLTYPGQIKVTVIRETRAVEYAK